MATVPASAFVVVTMTDVPFDFGRRSVSIEWQWGCLRHLHLVQARVSVKEIGDCRCRCRHWNRCFGFSLMLGTWDMARSLRISHPRPPAPTTMTGAVERMDLDTSASTDMGSDSPMGRAPVWLVKGDGRLRSVASNSIVVVMYNYCYSIQLSTTSSPNNCSIPWDKCKTRDNILLIK